MAAKRKETEATQEAESIPQSNDSLVITISKLNSLSEKEKLAFRNAGGTAIEG
jgi:hypothetical protein